MIQFHFKRQTLKCTYENGLNDEGKEVFRSKTYANVNPEADAKALRQAANALFSLSERALFQVETSQTSEIY